ncbi:hypothetical protein Fuma_05506 [Fuerstiella marisgermanici]|uniref:Uncharacterized protein n=1 Tax=Fuerstiella marisgermanici TaxID=1891926 RepID=A0A1P8WP58_9PLAN|nr:hypothetical protein Fuma_05506 [Fuerstiella marisgermanici]
MMSSVTQPERRLFNGSQASERTEGAFFHRPREWRDPRGLVRGYRSVRVVPTQRGCRRKPNYRVPPLNSQPPRAEDNTAEFGCKRNLED